jgi:serine/threonine-protein kinase
MGVVYRARYVGNNRLVAVKLLPDEVAANPTLVARFERELEVLKQLKHPHIVHCFGGLCESKQRFYAMELVEGGTLHSLLSEVGKLPWETVVEYGLQMCAALDFAHSRRIVHRDVKPANFLITRSGKLKLSDFGLAVVAASQRITAAGKTLGTFHYMAPEQIRGKPPVSSKTDLYALGCVFFEMLTGNPPFDAENAAEVLHKHLKEPPPRVRDLEPDCPLDLDLLVADLLQKEPDQRPASAAVVAERLKSTTAAPSLGVSFLSLTPTAPRAVVDLDSSPATTSPESTAAPLNWWLAAGLVVALSWLVVVQLNAWKWKARALQAEESLVSTFRTGTAEVKLSLIRTLTQMETLEPATQKLLVEQLSSEEQPVRLAVVNLMISRPELARIARGDLARLDRADPDPEVRNNVKLALEASKRAGGGGSLASAVFRWLTILATCGVIAGLAWYGYQWGKRNAPFHGA